MPLAPPAFLGGSPAVQVVLGPERVMHLPLSSTKSPLKSESMLPEASRTNIRLGRTEEPPAVASGVEEIVTVPASAGCARQTRPAAMSRAIGALSIVFIFRSSPGGGSLSADERLDESDRVARPHRLRGDAVVRRRRPGEVVRRAGV